LAADAKAKRFSAEIIICNIPEISRAAKKGPGTPKASGPMLFSCAYRAKPPGATFERIL